MTRVENNLSKKRTTGSLSTSDMSIFLPFARQLGCFFFISQPMCEKNRPRFALCGSAGVSLYLWCTLWSLTQACSLFFYWRRKWEKSKQKYHLKFKLVHVWLYTILIHNIEFMKISIFHHQDFSCVPKQLSLQFKNGKFACLDTLKFYTGC